MMSLLRALRFCARAQIEINYEICIARGPAYSSDGEAAQRFAFAEHGAGAGVDSAWDQEKLEATQSEMLDAKRAARREAAVPSVQCITRALGQCHYSPRSAASGRVIPVLLRDAL